MAILKFDKNEVRQALEKAHEIADQRLQEYLKENTKWAKILEGIKSRKNHRLDELIVVD